MKHTTLIEWLAVGGLTLLAWPFVQFYDINSLASLPTLILIFSLPHFALSYFLFYSQKGLARQHWIAAYVVPALLLIALIALGGNKTRMSFFVHAGFFMFFHHIAKQAFGVGLFYSGAPTRFSRFWKYSLLVTCLLWGLTTWLEQQSKPGTFMAFKNYLDTLELAPTYAMWSRRVALAAVGVCLIAWLRVARRAPPSAILMSWTPLLALVVWCQPELGLTPLGLMPVLHGFQYLPFTWRKMQKEGWRPMAVVAISLAALPIGWAIFTGASTWILKAGSSEVWVSILYVFLNVHHYVLDRYMWKRKSFYERGQTTPAASPDAVSEAA